MNGKAMVDFAALIHWCKKMFGWSCLHVFFLCVFAGAGCTETMDLELQSTTSRLVVEGGVVELQTMQYIRLTESAPFFQDSASSAITGANVIVSDGRHSEEFEEVSELPGFYVSTDKITGVPGETYSLFVSGIDLDKNGQDETYTATSYMPFVNEPDSIGLEYDEDWKIWKILLYGKDNPHTEDYYMFRVFKNGTLVSENITELNVVSDKFFDGNRAQGAWVQSLDATAQSKPLEDGDVISLQMCGITKEYYEFIEAIQREKRGQYPLFSGPPANAPGNISNGALGFFSAYSASFASVVYEE